MSKPPVAWLAYAPDASESSFVTLFREQAEAAARDWGWIVEPLFAGLTDAEREAVRFCAVVLDLGQRPDCAATLRGLLERHCPVPENAAKQDTTPTRESTPGKCTVSPEWTSRPHYVDPPSGWRYGFPRLYDPKGDGDMVEWLIRNGYPEEMARQGLPCTFTAQQNT